MIWRVSRVTCGPTGLGVIGYLRHKARAMALPRRPVRRPVRGLPIVRKNTVRLPGDVAHRVRAGHPWVYREALGPRPLMAEPGTEIDCVDSDGEFVGRGLYDGDSAIALRVFVRKPDIAIDGKLVRERVRA